MRNDKKVETKLRLSPEKEAKGNFSSLKRMDNYSA